MGLHFTKIKEAQAEAFTKQGTFLSRTTFSLSFLFKKTVAEYELKELPERYLPLDWLASFLFFHRPIVPNSLWGAHQEDSSSICYLPFSGYYLSPAPKWKSLLMREISALIYVSWRPFSSIMYLAPLVLPLRFAPIISLYVWCLHFYYFFPFPSLSLRWAFIFISYVWILFTMVVVLDDICFWLAFAPSKWFFPLLTSFFGQVLSLSLCAICFWSQGFGSAEHKLWTRLPIQAIQSAVGGFPCCKVLLPLFFCWKVSLCGVLSSNLLFAALMHFLNSIGDWCLIRIHLS